MKIAIVGASGLVGRKTLQVLEEKNIVAEYILYASKKSAGKTLLLFNKDYIINELTIENITKHKFDYVLFCAGAKLAKVYVPIFINNGAVVVDFSSQFRMSSAPLVVPEVNMQKAYGQKLICNPNCSTIGAVVALNDIYKKFGLQKLIVSTYQAVSGAGKNAIDDLYNGEPLKKFDYPIKNNTLCYIGELEENGYTNEELKMVNELQKILDNYNIKVCTTCVRIPVEVCHGESIWFKTTKKCSLKQINKTLKTSENVVVVDEYPHYPMPIECAGQDKVFVGRIRQDLHEENAFCFYIVSDNLRKGASANAVQILINLTKGED